MTVQLRAKVVSHYILLIKVAWLLYSTKSLAGSGRVLLRRCSMHFPIKRHLARLWNPKIIFRTDSACFFLQAMLFFCLFLLTSSMWRECSVCVVVILYFLRRFQGKLNTHVYVGLRFRRPTMREAVGMMKVRPYKIFVLLLVKAGAVAFYSLK